MSGNAHILFLTALLLLPACAVQDIRPDTAAIHWNESRGRELLEKAARIHGESYWKTLETYEISLEDRYFGFWGKLASPFPKNSTLMRLQYIPQTFTGRAIFGEGKWEGKIWGLQSWKTYTLSPRGRFRIENSASIAFHLSAYQYFIEFPFRIKEADIVAYIGEKMDNQIKYQRVFATWETAKAKKSHDQYIIWINAQTGRIEKLEYTIRDLHKSLRATARFRDFRRIGGGWLIPEKVSIQSPLQTRDWLHEWQLQDFIPNPIAPEELGPIKNWPLSTGTAKPLPEK